MFTDATSFHGHGVEFWNISFVHDMGKMFWGASLFDANLSLWDVSQVATMYGMFNEATQFHGFGVEHWNVLNAQDMAGMFRRASLFDANLSQWVVSQVTEMLVMFNDAISFHGLGVEHWDVSRV
jgi:hypothetical protein